MKASDSADEIDKLRQELDKTKKDLEEFIYLASHDLKAPLNAIDNLANWLVEDISAQVGEESLEHLAMIKNRARRAKLMITSLLAYSRVGSEAEEYELIDFKQTVMLCAAQVSANKFELEIDGCDLILPRHSFISVLTELLLNAVKHHSKQYGKIRVRCKKLADRYQIEVSDDGPGIDPSEHEKAFKKFQTLKPRDEIEGSGMGLALVEKTLGLYNASITLLSDGKSGCTFVINWPFA